MATATYSDYIGLYPSSSAAQSTVEAWIERAADAIAIRCEKFGTTYDELAQRHETTLKGVECAAAWRRCDMRVEGIDTSGLESFSQSVGDHSWTYGYGSSGAVSSLVLDNEYKELGLTGQRIGWVGMP